MTRKQWQFIRTLLIVIDTLVTIASFYLAYGLRNYLFEHTYGNLQGIGQYSWMLAVIIPVWPFALSLFKVYDSRINRNFNRTAKVIFRLFPAVFISILFLATSFYFTMRVEISRLFFVLFAAVNLFLLWMDKLLVQLFWSISVKNKNICKKVILVGIGDRSNFTNEVNKNPQLLIDIVGYVQFNETPYGDPKKFLGHLPQLIEIVRENIVDEIMFDIPGYLIDTAVAEIAYKCELMGITTSIVLNLFDFKIAKTDIYTIGRLPVVTFSTINFSVTQTIVKRGLDIIGGTIGTIFTALLFIFIAPAIKLDSEGPVFFSQYRPGRNGRRFKIYKFRTMHKDAEDRKQALLALNEMNGGLFKITNDPRVTRVGKFLRKTSLDEFPQFFNVLKGDMSLVGTRPPTLNDIESYELHHWRRLSIKPGLTGIWQVSGRNSFTDFEEIVKLEEHYIDNWSLWLDIKILFKTLFVVFTQEGAK